jgi:hypothetical protein
MRKLVNQILTSLLGWKVISRRAFLLLLALGIISLLTAMGLAQSQYFNPSALSQEDFIFEQDPLPGGQEFAWQRLNAYSGSGFTLFPDLAEICNLFENSCRQKAESAVLPIEFNELIKFCNPEFVKFRIYRIQPHDNFWAVARKNGYTIDTIVGCNPQMAQVICYVNQKVLLPSCGGSLHQVQPGETLNQIALDYQADSKLIQQANEIREKWGLLPGMWIFIPGAKPVFLNTAIRTQYSKRALFRSPLSGRYTSFVGLRIHPVLGFSKFHNGVDIACKNRSWVGAAASGSVIYAGWGGAIGKYIKIDHHNGFQTVYGHLDAIFVRPGQTIKGGQLIGRSGSTGRVTGPHLHFAILENGRIRDPMDFLW